ncbi:hypothetical protein GQ600_1224 [Phytophthora cactorum]|nr:hypothetical protein GQ600_1224 [Phytophthora cactorum]
MFLREGDDGLKLDQTQLRCENTVQGVRLLTDSMAGQVQTWLLQRDRCAASADKAVHMRPV